MSEDNGHKFQWSKFSPDRTEQFVIRTDDKTEFDELVAIYRDELPKAAAFPDDEGRYATPPGKVQKAVQVCPVHHKPFREGKFGMYCATKMEDGSWCKEHPKEAV